MKTENVREGVAGSFKTTVKSAFTAWRESNLHQRAQNEGARNMLPLLISAVSPSFAGNKFSPTHAGILLLCIWAYALAFAIAPLADWGSYGPEPYGTACCITWKASTREAMVYVVALFIFCYIIPCLLIVISYSLILWTVKVSRRAVKQHMSAQSKNNSVHSLIVKVGKWGRAGGIAGRGLTTRGKTLIWGDAERLTGLGCRMLGFCSELSHRFPLTWGRPLSFSLP